MSAAEPINHKEQPGARKEHRHTVLEVHLGCLILRTMSTDNKKPIAVSFDRTEIFDIEPENFYGVDLGLPSGRLWASMNVGAHAEEDAGLSMNFDTANAIKFQGSWHVPSPEDFKELYHNTKSEWTTRNGIPGRTFTGKNGNSIFLPAAGYTWFDDEESGTTLIGRGSNGIYWSSGFYSASNAYNLLFNSTGVNPQLSNNRRYGFSVRAVL